MTSDAQMLTNETVKMLDAWKGDIFGELGISEIMKISRKKTKPWVFNALKHLTGSRLLVSKRKGNLDIYRLNLSNPLLMHALQYIDTQKSLDFPYLNILIETIEKIPLRNYCLLVFGSYANGSQRKKSDLDICFLVGNGDEKKIRPHFSDIKLASTVEIDEHYITFDDFVKMLLREEENLAKQIFRNHKLFFNPDIYFKLIMEAHKNGFRPQ